MMMRSMTRTMMMMRTMTMTMANHESQLTKTIDEDDSIFRANKYTTSVLAYLRSEILSC